jgi:hypothetical protein
LQRYGTSELAAVLASPFRGEPIFALPLFIDSFKYNDPTEFECADDLLVRRPIAGKNHANRRGNNAVLFRPFHLASRSVYLRTKQSNHVLLI